MRDGILKGTGDSRYLKTVEDALTRYPRYEDFVAALIAGTFPFDLNGVNPAGWAQQGTALNKGTLLKDYTAENLGLTPAEDATPAEVLEALRSVATRDTENLLINSDFRDPIDDRNGWVVPPGASYRQLEQPQAIIGTTDRYYVATLDEYNNAHIFVDGVERWVYAGDEIHAVRGYIGNGIYTINGWMLNDSGGKGVVLINEDGTVTIVNGNSEYPIWWTQPTDKNFDGLQRVLSSLVSEVGGTVWLYGFDFRGKPLEVGLTSIVETVTPTDNVAARFVVSPNSSVTIKAAKLELGSTQTLTHQDEDGNWVLNDPPSNRSLERLKLVTSTADATDTYANMDIFCTKLLWENASSNSDFAAQTIPLDLSAYDAVMIITAETAAVSFVKKGEGRLVLGVYGPNYSVGSMLYSRRATVSAKGVEFSQATHNGRDYSNNQCKPLYIYGIKGVS